VLLPSFALQALAAGASAAAADWCAQGLEVAGDDPSSIPAGYSLLAATQIAAHAGDLQLAASIHGRLREAQVQLYAALDQGHIAAYEAAIERVRTELGLAAFETAAAIGAGLDWVAAVTEVKGYLRQAAVRQRSQPPRAAVTPVLLPAQPLTVRQLDVVRLLAGGFTNKEIAGRLGMTPKTVMHHTVAIYQRLGVRGRSEAVAWAIRAGAAPETS
jgi:DNA-binding CsgD family transcriptional regulator